MQADINYTPSSTPSPEFVRKGATGLELVTVTDGQETVTPVQITSQIKNNRIMVGLEPKPILWTLPNGQTRLLEVI